MVMVITLYVSSPPRHHHIFHFSSSKSFNSDSLQLLCFFPKVSSPSPPSRYRLCSNYHTRTLRVYRLVPTTFTTRSDPPCPPGSVRSYLYFKIKYGFSCRPFLDVSCSSAPPHRMGRILVDLKRVST
ncbi:uncharacterized protein LOC120193908 [Hibiscus syriacus]|uniref:uncharacterized protein LOC120193908 n=1 Tax=Hibiscus syriacus TaxID=106335 RepID=UPI001921C1FF|nr:uncharacterized protein LOC120193908 [Hibiscus syriacus]